LARAVTAALTPLLALLLAVLPASGAAPRTAVLKLQALAPLTVAGHSFGPRERVLLLFAGPNDARSVASIRATKLGRFRVEFRRRVARCDSFTVRAVGTAGSRAVLQVERRCGKTKGPPKQALREQPKAGGAG
jgi:hypothetical protein